MLGLPHYPNGFSQYNANDVRRTGGIAGYFNDVDALIPYPELKQALHAKYQQSGDFKAFMELIHIDHIELFLKSNMNAQKFVKFL